MFIADMRKHGRGESAFTLIELLVVMIIIAILMAVAVPTFLKQKQTAIGTKAKANLKQIQNAIESCAATNTSGMVTSNVAGERNCTAVATITADEPSLTNYIGANNEQVQIAAVGTQGYTLTARFAAENNQAGTFVLTNDGNGQITRTCAPANSKAGCVSGAWK